LKKAAAFLIKAIPKAGAWKPARTFGFDKMDFMNELRTQVAHL
jgi:hypothetical protein